MRFMVIYPATKDSEQEGALPDPQLMADMNKFIYELIKAGVLLTYDGLHPSSKKALASTSQASFPKRHSIAFNAWPRCTVS